MIVLPYLTVQILYSDSDTENVTTARTVIIVKTSFQDLDLDIMIASMLNRTPLSTTSARNDEAAKRRGQHSMPEVRVCGCWGLNVGHRTMV